MSEISIFLHFYAANIQNTFAKVKIADKNTFVKVKILVEVTFGKVGRGIHTKKVAPEFKHETQSVRKKQKKCR